MGDGELRVTFDSEELVRIGSDAVNDLKPTIDRLKADIARLTAERDEASATLAEILSILPDFPAETPATCGASLMNTDITVGQLRQWRAALALAPAAEAPVGRSRSALLRRVAELEEMVRVDNAVCLCGCGEHENLGEDGESCGDDAHFCLRVAPSVLSYVNGLRAALIAPAAEGKGTVKESLSVGETARTHASAPAAEAGRTGWTGCDCKEPCGLKQDELSEWDYCPNCDHAPKCHAAPKQRGSE